MKEVFSVEQNMAQSEPKRSNRLPYIDIMKGIGIFLVVYAHMIIAYTERYGRITFLVKYVYAFHMQLFFFITGYCLSIKYQYNQKGEIKNLGKRLLIPYFLWSGIYLFLGQVGGGRN